MWSAQAFDQDASPKLARTERPSNISFHNIALKQALALVEQGYGVVFQYADGLPDLGSKPVSGEFHNAPIGDVLAQLLPRFGLTHIAVDARTIRIEQRRP